MVLRRYIYSIPLSFYKGGWGKPPVDEQGKPLYGDVFGTSDTKQFPTQTPEEVSIRTQIISKALNAMEFYD